MYINSLSSSLLPPFRKMQIHLTLTQEYLRKKLKKPSLKCISDNNHIYVLGLNDTSNYIAAELELV